MRGSFYFIFIFFIFTHISYASEPICPESSKDITLEDQFCELRDQDSVGWCYAFVAADLMTAQAHRSQGVDVCNNRISPISVANNYIKEFDLEDRKEVFDLMVSGELDLTKDFAEAEGGVVNDAALETIKNTFCYEKELSSEDDRWSKGVECEGCNFEDVFNDMFSFYNNPNSPVCRTNSIEAIQKIFVGMGIHDILNILRQVDRDELYDYLTKSQCVHKIKDLEEKHLPKTIYYSWDAVKKSKLHFISKFNPPRYKKNIDGDKGPLDWSNILDQKLAAKVPVGIDIYPEFLKGKKVGDNAKPSLDDGDDTEKQHSPKRHSVIVMGSQHNCETGKEEYIVRNSWGSSCAPYKKNKTFEMSNGETRCKVNIRPLSGKAKDIDGRDTVIAYYTKQGDAERVKYITEDYASHVYVEDSQVEIEKLKCITDVSMMNPKIRCNAGILYIEKEELVKYIYRATVIE